MNFFATVTIVVVLALFERSSAGVVPAAVAAPLAAPVAAPVAAPAAIGYAKAVPYNVPPYASRVDIATKTLAAPIIASAPFVAAAPAAAPVVAAPAPAPVVAAPATAPIVAAPGLIHPAYAGFAYAPAIFG